MLIERPAWFVLAERWWRASVPYLARHSLPVGCSPDGQLIVRCSDAARGTILRLGAPKITDRLNAQRPPGVPEISTVRVVQPPPVPTEVHAHWADLVGADLAEDVRPDYLTDWGQELTTEARSAEARDLLARRAPVVLARLRALLPDTPIAGLRLSSLRPVRVLIASSPQFTDREWLERTLMDVWFDVSQTEGPEHPLFLTHAGETEADQMVEKWATDIAHTTPLASSLRVLTFLLPPSPRQTDSAQHQENDRLADGPYDLCVEFAAREGEHLPLAELARKCGVNTWQHPGGKPSAQSSPEPVKQIPVCRPVPEGA
ncbi:DciA family protein [Streptomyces sp. CBG9]|uniref:DciA family protein n=1 Tax=Streptomyces sp. CBG9 TaxID=2762622 RepID=UPI0016456008|nr:DciA family protein [Streptomyces sp. CBG9]